MTMYLNAAKEISLICACDNAKTRHVLSLRVRIFRHFGLQSNNIINSKQGKYLILNYGYSD